VEHSSNLTLKPFLLPVVMHVSLSGNQTLITCLSL